MMKTIPLFDLMSRAQIALGATGSGDGRCAGRENRNPLCWGVYSYSGEGLRSPISDWYRQKWYGRGHQRAGEMNNRTERAIAVGMVRRVAARRSRRARCLDLRRCLAGEVTEMHVPEGERELKRERKQRNERTRSQTRSKPMHRVTLHACATVVRTLKTLVIM